MDRYLSVKEVVECTGLGRSTVYALFQAPGFPATRIGKRLIVSETALNEWLAKGGTQKNDNGLAG